MLDYLKNYKKLLELKETNQKEIQENKLLIDENLKKWIDETAKETNLNSELETLNEKYKETREQKENRIVDVVGFISLSVSIITVIILAARNPILAIAGPFIALMTSASIYMLTYLIIKTTPILQKYFLKDKTITNLLTQIKTKEKALSESKELLEKYSKELIKHRSKSKQLQEKKNYIEESFNELMRSYAQPIFEEQLKNYQEESEEKDNQQPKTKTRKQ